MLTALTGALAGSFHVLAGPDHLAAVAPLALDRKSRGWMAGWTWGVGHATGVVVVAALVATAGVQMRSQRAPSVAENWALLDRYCVSCHNERNKDRVGSLTLASFDMAKAGQEADVAERMIRKLQASMKAAAGLLAMREMPS